MTDTEPMFVVSDGKLYKHGELIGDAVEYVFNVTEFLANADFRITFPKHTSLFIKKGGQDD